MRKLWSIVKDETFILATRDSGYRSTAAAVSELIDNAIQAEATKIDILISENWSDTGRELSLSVLDNGVGMGGAVLRSALQFGGTSRFNDRSGQGRYGIGLPNSSLSQARRLEVLTWQKQGTPIFAYIDVDEIAGRKLNEIPTPRKSELPVSLRGKTGKQGTLVTWSKCDRLDFRKATTLADSIAFPLGRRFRNFLWKGLQLRINGKRVRGVDPLYLHDDAVLSGATSFQTPIKFDIRLPQNPSLKATVIARFSELPVSDWHERSNEEKHLLGISKGAGVSIVRAEREIDYGWYFMGQKRKENYDDWWRCEICFSPALDEFFGVTHSKQSINPTADLGRHLAASLEPIAHALNARVRTAFQLVKRRPVNKAVRLANQREPSLPPLSEPSLLEKQRKRLRQADGTLLEYEIKIQAMECPDFYVGDLCRGVANLTINRNHPFFTDVYEPATRHADRSQLKNLEILLLASLRADLVASKGRKQPTEARHRAWSDALAAFIGG